MPTSLAGVGTSRDLNRHMPPDASIRYFYRKRLARTIGIIDAEHEDLELVIGQLSAQHRRTTTATYSALEWPAGDPIDILEPQLRVVGTLRPTRS